MTGSITAQIFVGIATVDFEGVAHDAYMSIHTESVGYAIRWFGTFEWMGPAPDNFRAGGLHDVVLSDGRECVIRIPGYQPEMDHLQFLGTKLPPGFEWFEPGQPSTSELTSTTPSFWRRLPARILGLSSLVSLAASFWVDGWSLELSGTAFCLMVAAIALIPRSSRTAVEVPLDCPR